MILSKKPEDCIKLEKGKTCEAVRAGKKLKIMELILKFVSKAFRIFFAILLWIVLIVSVLGGLIQIFIGEFLIGLGAIVGGPIVVILLGGYIATYLRNSENLERMANKLDPKQ